MKNPICMIKTIYLSIRHLAFISGCDFEIDETPTPENVQVLKCKVCGTKSTAWSWCGFVP